ncbi:dNA replication protein [Geobacillus phage GR1]|nr:dNA replication protein [Geobacillus phage GR1]
MSNIIKRRKTVQYAQIHNSPLQTLEDIRSIGLIAHLMSLPETWEIRKMQLYSKFGRAAISHAIKELEEKKHWIDIKYRNGKKNEHVYYISDIPFKDEEVEELISEVQIDFKIMEISEAFKHLLSIGENQQLKESRQINDFSIVENQQLNINSSFSTVENEHLLNKININKINIKEIDINKNLNLNPKPVDIYEILWDCDIPQELKNRIKVMIVNKQISLNSSQILEIEDAYKYQISKGFIIPNCSMEDSDGINDYEFSNTVVKMLARVRDIKNMRGLIKEWVEQAFAYKKEQFYVFDYSSTTKSVLYDWLNDDK